MMTLPHQTTVKAAIQHVANEQVHQIQIDQHVRLGIISSLRQLLLRHASHLVRMVIWQILSPKNVKNDIIIVDNVQVLLIMIDFLVQIQMLLLQELQERVLLEFVISNTMTALLEMMSHAPHAILTEKPATAMHLTTELHVLIIMPLQIWVHVYALIHTGILTQELHR